MLHICFLKRTCGAKTLPLNEHQYPCITGTIIPVQKGSLLMTQKKHYLFFIFYAVISVSDYCTSRIPSLCSVCSLCIFVFYSFLLVMNLKFSSILSLSKGQDLFSGRSLIQPTRVFCRGGYCSKCCKKKKEGRGLNPAPPENKSQPLKNVRVNCGV